MSTHLLPFEALSVVLLVALVGAVAIVRKEMRPAGGPPTPEPVGKEVSATNPEALATTQGDAS